MRVSMLVAPWRSSRALLRRNGHPPAISTTTASTSTVHPAVAVSGAANATTRAAMASGHEMAARTPQWSVSLASAVDVSSTGDGAVADVGDGPAQLLGAQRCRVVGDEGAGGGQVDRGAGHRRQPAERPLDPGGAGAAVHAAQLQLGGGEGSAPPGREPVPRWGGEHRLGPPSRPVSLSSRLRRWSSAARPGRPATGRSRPLPEPSPGRPRQP